MLSSVVLFLGETQGQKDYFGVGFHGCGGGLPKLWEGGKQWPDNLQGPEGGGFQGRGSSYRGQRLLTFHGLNIVLCGGLCG